MIGEHVTDTWDKQVDDFKEIDKGMEFYKDEIFLRKPYTSDITDIAKGEVPKSQYTEIIDKNVMKKELRPKDVEAIKLRYKDEHPEEYDYIREREMGIEK
jgi:hypothetical protein